MAIKFLNTVQVDTDVLYVDAANNNVGIGTDSPSAKLEVSNGSSGFAGSYNGRTASVFEGNNSAGTTISIMSPDTGYSGIFFGNNTLETYGQLAFDHTSNSFKFINGGGTERMVISSAGALRLNTYGVGTLVSDASGNITVSSGGGAGGPYLPLAGGTMTGNIVLNDNIQLQLGTTADLRIYSNGTDNYINNINGHLNIRNNADDKDIYFQNDNGTGNYSTYFYLDGSLTNGTTTLGATRFPDNSKIFMGTGGDLVFNHDGTHSFINNLTGDLTIENAGDDLILKAADDLLLYVQGTEIALQAIGNGKVGLRYNNVEKFVTTSTGVSVTGDIQIDSALLSNQENTDVDTGAEVVAQVAIATYTAAFFDFVIKKTTNVRSGTVYACHDGTNVEFTETSTNDLGDTSDVTLSVDISGTNMRLLATVTSDDWSVKSLIRAI